MECQTALHRRQRSVLQGRHDRGTGRGHPGGQRTPKSRPDLPEGDGGQVELLRREGCRPRLRAWAGRPHARHRKDYRPKANAPLADKLYREGAILFAKSNMHELALGGTSANPTFGFVKNPYDLSRIPGGSSGGTAAAVA